MTLRTTKQLPSARSLEISGPKPLSKARAPEPSAATRLKVATTPARLQTPASRDGFETKPFKSGPTLSGNALNIATSPQLKTLGSVTGGNPELASARLASLGHEGIRGNSLLAQARLDSLKGKDLLASSTLLDGGVHTLGGEAAARTDDADAARELFEDQYISNSPTEVNISNADIQEALGPNSPLTPEQQEEYVAILATEHPELLTQSGSITIPGGQTIPYTTENQKLISDALARAHESGAVSDDDLREAAATFEDPTEFALALALGDETGEVGGPLDVVGQYYQEQARNTDDPEAENRYRVATALAFTSSEALINERLPTEAERVDAFSSVALQIDETFADGSLEEELNAAAQNQFAENATRLFGLAGAEIAENLATTSDSPFNSESAPRGTDILSQFFAGTLLSPRASELQVDGQPASEVLTRGVEAAYNHLWNQATNAEPGSGTQSSAFHKLGVFLGTVDTAAERVERQALKPEEKSKVVKLLADVLLDAIPTPPGVSPIASALLDEVLKSEPGEVDPSIENFAERYIDAYLEEIQAYEDIHPETDATGDVRTGIQETQIEDGQDVDG